ncbi:type VI secretion system baseplate subunit TssF/IglH [Dongshaea marina]|uniref:type VI secretion system baseplate subunit TssF/IglH n=1 Tax=Dongshaea marina TaxID=2047966 RepID=UPI000D3E0536|nr:type VI secretion system baseplate subunit TssF/IglH [Dongshaea marina]
MKTNSLDKEIDISTENYEYLEKLFVELSHDIKDSVLKQMEYDKELNLLKFNQHLLLNLPKHVLVKSEARLSHASFAVDYKSKFEVLDIDENERFTYSNLCDVFLSSFNVVDVSKERNNYIINLSSDAPVRINNTESNYIDIWVNPLLWCPEDYRLMDLKERVLSKKSVQVKLTDELGDTYIVAAHFEDQSCYSLPLNDLFKLKLISPEFFLGMRLVIDDYPWDTNNSKFSSMQCYFEVDFDNDIQLMSFNSNPLFVTNIIPIFNLFEGYSVSKSIDKTLDNIPLICRDDNKAIAKLVQKVWINNHSYEEYYDPSESEFFFNPYKSLMSYCPKSISLDKYKKVFVKGLWMQGGVHSDRLSIKTRSFICSNNDFVILHSKDGALLNKYEDLNAMTKVLDNFTDLDIRKHNGFLFALSFLFGYQHQNSYNRFLRSIDTICYDTYLNKLVITSNYQQDISFIRYVSAVIVEFFTANNPLMVKFAVQVK